MVNYIRQYNKDTKRWEEWYRGATNAYHYVASTKTWEKMQYGDPREYKAHKYNAKTKLWEPAYSYNFDAITEKQFRATWNRSYTSANVRNHIDNGDMYMGKYGRHNTVENIIYDPIYWGNQRSLIGFDFAEIQKAISGKAVVSIDLYLKNKHTWYVAGGDANIITHSFTAPPSTFDYTENRIASTYFKRGQHKWVSLDTKFAKQLAEGTITGFGLMGVNDDPRYYGYYAGRDDDSHYPTIRIRYYNTDYVPDKKYQSDFWRSQLGDKPLSIGTVTTSNGPQYTEVQSGDGLWQISQRLINNGLVTDVTVNQMMERLMELNGFSSTNPFIYPNQKLRYK